MTGAGSFIAFRQRNKNLQKIGKIEGFGVEVKVNSEATRMVRVSLTSFIHTDFLASNSLSLAIRMPSNLLAYGGYHPMGALFPAFRGTTANQSVFLSVSWDFSEDEMSSCMSRAQLSAKYRVSVQ